MVETPEIEKPPLTPLRWIFAIIGALVTLFAGGCGLFFIGTGIIDNSSYAEVLVVLGLLYGGLPALIGALVWWAAVKWRRMPEP